MNQGFILLHRKFMSWEWYQDKNTKILFIHCLLNANFEEKTWQGITIKRGQFFTSINHLSIDLKMSIKEIRTALKKLQKTNEIVQKGASNGTMITVCKYDSYQEKQKPKGKRRASEGQGKGKRGATTNNDKQLNNDNNVNNKDILFTYENFIFLFNEITKRNFKGDSKSEGHFNQRIKKYNGAEFGIAIRNAFNDEYLRQNPKYLTPEYITRENQIEKWLNVVEGEETNGKFKKPDFEKIKEYGRKLNK